MQKILFSDLVEKYANRTDEDVAFEAGRAILAGDYSIKNLRAIVMWKSPRTTGKKLETNKSIVEGALMSAVHNIDREGLAIESLLVMKGVGIPVASAIMTALDPTRYTIIDYRALATLQIDSLPPEERFCSENAKDSIGEYLDYLNCCKRLARANGISLRGLDYALWQYSYEEGLDWI